MIETRLAQDGRVPATLPSACGGGLQGTAARCSPDNVGAGLCAQAWAQVALCVSLRWLEQMAVVANFGG